MPIMEGWTMPIAPPCQDESVLKEEKLVDHSKFKANYNPQDEENSTKLID